MSAVAERFENEEVDVTELPLDTRFTLGERITPLQMAFLEAHGFLIFGGVASRAEVDSINTAVNELEARWIAEAKESINGVPIFQGIGLNDRPMLQRIPFTSAYSNVIRDFIRDDRFRPIQALVGEDCRIGDLEKDGCVVNTFVNVPGSVYPRLGWHTDGLRDLFYLRMPKQMLNVGIHLTDCPVENGGLRLLPGTHTQGFWKMCFHKAYFVDHRPDPKEICIETRAGDLTVHDGRLWHRVERSPHQGPASFRRSMYVPYLTDEYQPKSEESGTAFYHHLGALGRKLKLWRAGKK